MDAKVKKILVLNPYIPTLGGGEKHMGYLCQFMEEYFNYEVMIDILVFDYNEVKVSSPDYVTVKDINKQFGLNLKKTRILKLEIPSAENVVQAMQQRRGIEKLTENYDLFINFMFMSKHIGKAKYNIYECMFPTKKFIPHSRIKKIFSSMEKKHDREFYDSYQYFIANSEFTKEWLERYWTVNDKNIVIYPPVFAKEEMEGKYVEDEKENIIISCGRFFVGSHSKKQLDLVQFFVKHTEIFKEFEYHLVGAISNDPKDLAYLREIEKLAQKVNNIYIHTNSRYEELMKLYRKAKIFWHGTGYGIDDQEEPEKMEHFGITTVEAMSNGAVPVVINKGGQRETVIDGVTGFTWDTEEECIEKTKRIIQDDNLRKQMAEKSVVRANEYSIEQFYERNRKIFNEL